MFGSLVNNMGLGVILSYRDKMSAGVNKSASNLSKLKDEAKKTGGEVEKQAERMAAAMEKYTRMTMLGLKMMGAGAAILAPLILASKSTANLEESMLYVNSLLVDTGLTQDQVNAKMKKFGDILIDTNRKSIQPFKEIGDASYALISALGFDKGIAAIKIMADLATAGKANSEESTAFLTKMMSTYGEFWGATMTTEEKIDRIAQKGAATVKMFDTNLTKLRAGAEEGVAAASTAGIPFEQYLAIIGIFQTKAKDAGRAGSTFNATLRGITELMSQKTKGTFLEGIITTNSRGKLLDIWDITKQIESRLGPEGLTGRRMKEMQDVLGDEASQGIKLLLGYSDELRRKTEALSKSNPLKQMKDIIQSGLLAQTKLFGGSLTNIGLLAGSHLIGPLTALVTTLKNIANAIYDFGKAHPVITQLVVGMTALIGSTLFVGGGFIAAVYGIKLYITTLKFAALVTAGTAKSINLLTIATRIATAAQWLWNAAFMASPIGWIILGVIALGAAVYGVIHYWDDITEAVGKFGLKVLTVWNTVVGAVKAATDAIKNIVMAFINSPPIQLYIKLWEMIFGIAGKAINFIGGPKMGMAAMPGMGPMAVQLPAPKIPISTQSTTTVDSSRTNSTVYNDYSRPEMHVHPPKGASTQEIAEASLKLQQEQKKRSKSGMM